MTATASSRRSGKWLGLAGASLGVIVALRLTEALNPTTAYLLLIIPVLLCVQFFRTSRMEARTRTVINRAALDYMRRFGLASFGYMLGLGIAIALWNRFALNDPLIFAISLLPALPTFGMIYAMGKYLAEEQDEYLRYRAVSASLWGLGLVLALGTFWGFMEMFELVPHIWSWWVMPVWALGLGVGQGVMGWRDRAPDEAAETD